VPRSWTFWTNFLRFPIVARYKDMGTVCILGKIESGTIKTGDKLVMMPGKTQLVCLGLIIDDQECDMAVPGENVVVKVKGCEEEDVRGGMVLSHSSKPSSTATEFIGQIWVLDLLEHKPLITAGYAAVLHTHSLSVECMITQLVSQLDKKTNLMEPKRPRYLKSQSVGNVKITVEQSIAIETFKDFPQMGRFTLRDEGKTIGIGKTLKLLELK
jgi:peptide chain release factor subunit 3